MGLRGCAVERYRIILEMTTDNFRGVVDLNPTHKAYPVLNFYRHIVLSNLSLVHIRCNHKKCLLN